jgi:hypothetical protein
MGELPHLIERARAATEKVTRSRGMARADAIRVMRRLERLVMLEFGRERIRGMPELAHKLHGARVRGHIAAPLPPADSSGEGREVLIVARTGELQMVRRMMASANSCIVVGRAAEDADLQAEDLELYAGAIVALMRRHLEQCDRSAARYGEIQQLAERLQRVLAA